MLGLVQKQLGRSVKGSQGHLLAPSRTFTASFSTKGFDFLSQNHEKPKMSLLKGTTPAPETSVEVQFVAAGSDVQSKFPSVAAPTFRDFEAKKSQQIMVYPDANKRVLLVGLGDEAQVDELTIRNATHRAISTIRSKGLPQAVLTIPETSTLQKERLVQLMTQASALSNYAFDRHLSLSEGRKQPLSDIFIQGGEEFQKIFDEEVAIAEETINARNLGNERSETIDPEFMEKVARTTAELPGVSIEVLQYEDLKEKGLDMMAHVGQAATSLPRLVVLEYKGNPDSEEKVGLVGKGITFDTGGLNLKPTGYIEDMHTDMCGSAAVLGAIRAAAKQGLKTNIVAALALAENAIGSKAVKPHAIVKSLKGISVEVNNTDAEGRLVLGDALTYVQQNYKPKTVIDVATLTGACIVALGPYAAGVFTNSDKLATKIQDAGNERFERCWKLPILPEHSEELKGHLTDSRSTGLGREGGASTAAAFLKQFVEKDVEWAHIDIAGPSSLSKPVSYFPKGATGFGVQVLYKYIKDNHMN